MGNQPNVTVGQATAQGASSVSQPPPTVTIGQASLASNAPMNDTGASSLVIYELETGRSISLRERALPQKTTGLKFISEQRIDEGEYTGYPQISQSALGGREKDTDLAGCWKDRFILDKSARMVSITAPDDEDTTPDASDVQVDGATFATTTEKIEVSSAGVPIDAASLCKLFEDMTYAGRVQRVQWRHIVRVGRLATFEQNWITAHDVEWKMSFKWIGRGEDVGTPSPGDSGVTDLASKLSHGYVDLHDATNFDGLQGLDPNVADLIDSRVGNIQRGILDLESTVEGRAAQAFGTISALRRGMALATFVRDESQNMIDDINAITAPAMIVARDPSDLTTIDAGSSFAAAVSQRKAVQAARALKHRAARGRFQGMKQVDATVIAIVLIRDGQDLRSLAQRFYRNSEDWEPIRSFNGFSSTSVPAGTVVFIPAQNRSP